MKLSKKTATNLFTVLAVIAVVAAIVLFNAGTLTTFSGGALVVSLVACLIGIREARKIPDEVKEVPAGGTGAVGSVGGKNDFPNTVQK